MFGGSESVSIYQIKFAKERMEIRNAFELEHSDSFISTCMPVLWEGTSYLVSEKGTLYMFNNKAKTLRFMKGWLDNEIKRMNNIK